MCETERKGEKGRERETGREREREGDRERRGCSDRRGNNGAGQERSRLSRRSGVEQEGKKEQGEAEGVRRDREEDGPGGPEPEPE
jgi:hypothetical protein